MSQSARKQRSPLLDCIRAVAIFMVIVYHAVQVYPGAVPAFAQFIYRIGPLSVDMFFPLSGYLISRYLLHNNGGHAIKAFFLRRFFRIIPLYYVALAAFLAVMLIFGFDADLLDRMWIPLLFLSAWFIAFDGHASVPYTISWTLSVEEFSYISFGVMAMFSRRFFPFYLILCVTLPSLLRWYMISEEIRGMWYLPLTRIDSIAWGGLVAWIVLTRTPLQTVLGLGAALVAMKLLGQADPALAIALSMNYVPIITCIFMVIFDFWMRGVTNPVIEAGANIGFYSYFLYLFHYYNIYALDIVVRELGLPYPGIWLFTAIAFGLTYVQAVISYRYFEGPLIQYGRSLEGPKPQPAKSAGVAS